MYKSKYLITEDKGEVKGYEAFKIIDNVSRETSKIAPSQIIGSILIASLIVFMFIR